MDNRADRPVHHARSAIKTAIPPESIRQHPEKPTGRFHRWIKAKEVVKDSPEVPDASHLDPEESQVLYDYYRQYLTSGPVGASDPERTYQDSSGAGTVVGAAGADTSGRNTDDAMTRSEEQLRVGTQPVEEGRARLRKYVVTEQESVTVPVSHEEVRVEREPITDANRDDAYAGPEISEGEHEVVLHAERPVVSAEAVPVERVRLDTETVTEQQTVTGQVRKEEVELEDGRDATEESTVERPSDGRR